ncbi:MAG TPA: hypothetical protein PLZ43_11160 [bacterium]|nr:hypothetical protein [bacterium]
MLVFVITVSLPVMMIGDQFLSEGKNRSVGGVWKGAPGRQE